MVGELKPVNGILSFYRKVLLAVGINPTRRILNFLRQEGCSGLILLLAVGLRVWDLGLKPPHFDEGINGSFVDRMSNQGYYAYDPTNYHGPLYFYGLHFMQTLFGRSIEVLRIATVLAGAGVVAVALWGYRRHVGRGASLWFGLFLAVSPALVFVSRYAIHEMFLLLFFLLLILGLFDRWSGRGGAWLICMGAAGMILTKETYLLHLICLGLAWITARMLARFSPDLPAQAANGPSWPGGRSDLRVPGMVGVIGVLFFYSGNLLAPAGVKGLWQTFATWAHTGLDAAGHAKPWYYWLTLMARYEWAALAGLIVGIRFVFPERRSIRFIVIAGAGTLVAYSIIPYKTPWCIVMLLVPGLLSLAVVLEEISRQRPRWKIAVVCVGALLAGHGLWATVRLNWERYDDPKEPYVYVQTSREVSRFVDPLFRGAQADGRRFHLPGAIVADAPFPLPWMLGEFSSIAYIAKTEAIDYRVSQARFLLVQDSRRAEVERTLFGRFFVRKLTLRYAQEPMTAYFREQVFVRYMNDAEKPVMFGLSDASQSTLPVNAQAKEQP